MCALNEDGCPTAEGIVDVGKSPKGSLTGNEAAAWSEPGSSAKAGGCGLATGAELEGSGGPRVEAGRDAGLGFGAEALAGIAIDALHLGHLATAGLASGWTDTLVWHVGQANICFGDDEGLPDREGAGLDADLFAVVSAPPGTRHADLHFGHLTCFPAAVVGTANP